LPCKRSLNALVVAILHRLTQCDVAILARFLGEVFFGTVRDVCLRYLATTRHTIMPSSNM
jgi:hypothetical protein